MTETDGTVQARRHAFRDQLQRVLPPSPAWDTWLQQTGELPPDFATLPSVAELPDPLAPLGPEGRAVTHPSEWRTQRANLTALFQQWVLGRVPPPPERVDSTVLQERQESGALVRNVQLTFGTAAPARLSLELLLPVGAGPFPVFLTQHNHRGWAQMALRRGYLACIYAGSDSRDDTDSYGPAYPGYDWSRLTRRAWSASRCVDFLADVPQADPARIILTGHSRNGKQALIAAALDERIAAVIASSPGAGGSLPARYCAEPHFAEGIEALTRVFPDWFHPRLRFFVGREHKLPVDMHELIALIAPRPCLLSTAINDPDESVWPLQESYLAARRVYRFLGAADQLRILWRAGAHETGPALIERYLDWSDRWFGRGTAEFRERLIYPSREDEEVPGEAAARPPDVVVPPTSVLGDTLRLEDGTSVGDLSGWARRKREIRAHVRTMLGEPVAAARRLSTGGEAEPAHLSVLLNRDRPGEGLHKEQVLMGDDVTADIYLPLAAWAEGRRLPTVLWLHPWSFPSGYVAAYRHGEQVFHTLARAGFAVCCFDQIGYGRRVEEADGYYARYPAASLLGHMVRDAQAALDALGTVPYVAGDQIYGVGYSLGSLVGLHAAALDDRLAGFAAVCGPPPFRLDTLRTETGGLQRWSSRYGLLPRLSPFIGQESRVPYDMHLLYACLAPRPLLIVSPQLDREAPVAQVRAAVEAARPAYALYGASERLVQHSPETYNQCGLDVQVLVGAWLKECTTRHMAQA